MRQLEHALKIHRKQAEYNLLMGECKVLTGQYKEAVQFFSQVVHVRPRNASGWEALIRCLYKGEYFEEALEQTENAIRITKGKPIFLFYKTANLFALGKTKEAIIQLEIAMEQAPKMLRKFVELNPAILQNQLVVDVLARFKRNRSI